MDSDGNYLKVVGDIHPKGCVVSYVKYFPSEYGTRIKDGKRYGYNSFVSKSFSILGDKADRVCFSPFHGGILTSTPDSKIVKVFSARGKLQEIVANKETYKKHKVGSELITFLEAIENRVDLGNLGITGSFLIDMQNESSDIDLVCYGEKTYRQLKKVFNKACEPYLGDNAMRLYARRMIHMADMNFDALIKQENRKLQGLTFKNKVHINCQPLREDSGIFADIELIEVGEISCVARIIEDREGIYSPAIYKIKTINVLDSLFDGRKQFKDEVKYLISFIGAYSNSFLRGDKVFLEGKLVQVRNGGKIAYGIELSPWNTNRTFKALLLN